MSCLMIYISVSELKNGFYWVKYLGEEQIAEYYNGSFLITGNENCQDPEIMDEINERVERGQYLPMSDVENQLQTSFLYKTALFLFGLGWKLLAVFSILWFCFLIIITFAIYLRVI